MRQIFTRATSKVGLAIVTSIAAVLALGGMGVANGANQYTVHSNVTKPAACNNFGTIPAGGWIANKPCGYVMGTAVAGSRFDVNATSGTGFHYGRTRGSDGTNFCTWIVPSALNLDTRSTVADSCSSATSDTLSHRLSFGRDFDVAPHTGNGAIIVRVNPSACTGYHNYFGDSSYANGNLRDAVGFALPTTGGYRYSSKDRQASMIRVDNAGETVWMWVARSCINSQLPTALNNQND